MGTRAEALADRLLQGAQLLAEFAEGLSDEEWNTLVPSEERTVGVIIHHVAHSYPFEVSAAREMATSKPIAGVTWDAIAAANAVHAQSHANVSKQETLDLLRRNSAAAAAQLRAFTDAELDLATTVSLYGDAPLTVQFVLEDHPVRHSFHHFANIRAALNR